MKPLICVLCNKPIPDVKGWAEGNDAQPLADGRCCNDCDRLLVIPARIAEVKAARQGGRK